MTNLHILLDPETKSWKWEGEGEEGEKVSLKTHATARGVGKTLIIPFKTLNF